MSNSFLVPRICFAEEVLKEYQRAEYSGPPGGAQKNRSNQFSCSGFLKAMRHLTVEMGTTPWEESKAWSGSAIFIELLNMTHDKIKWAIKFSGGKVLQAQSAQRFAIF